MATCRVIIRRALRLIQAIPAGTTPSTQENADALEGLQAELLQNPSVGLGGDFIESDVTGDYTVSEFERIRLTDSLTDTGLTFPATFTDWRTGVVRAPLNGALVHVLGTLSAAAFEKLYIYSAARAAWVEMTNLTLDTENPLGPAFDFGLAAMTAVRIAPEFLPAGTDPPPQVVLDAARCRSQITHTFRGRRDVDPDLIDPHRALR